MCSITSGMGKRSRPTGKETCFEEKREGSPLGGWSKRHYNGYKYERSQAMTTSLKLTKIGTSTGAVLPKEMLARMKVAKGDTLYAIETADGYLITPYDPAVEDELKAGREFMKDYRDTFKELAK
jgi:putative addiction module antidote